MHGPTDFVAKCCMWPSDRAKQDAVISAAAAIDNWEDVKAVVARHRVVPLVHVSVKSLNAVPKEFRDWAYDGAQSAAQIAMKMTHNCIKIDRALRAAGVNPLHLKGPVLAQDAYGSVTMKISHDLDILVEPHQTQAAIRVLETNGYRALGQTKPMSQRRLSAIMHNLKDQGFEHPDGTLIELHWRLLNYNGLISDVDTPIAPHTVRVANSADLNTLPPKMMIQYLCAHGASHHWTRLKWLADFSAYLNILPDDERKAALAEIEEGPSAIALAQSLKLCDTVLGTHYDPQMSAKSEALFSYALSRIQAPLKQEKRFSGDGGFIKDVVALRHLHPNFLSAIWASRHHLIGADDVKTFPLPRALNAAYVLVRVPSLLWRRLRK